MLGSGFRVQGLGFRVQGLGLRVEGFLNKLGFLRRSVFLGMWKDPRRQEKVFHATPEP